MRLQSRPSRRLLPWLLPALCASFPLVARPLPILEVDTQTGFLGSDGPDVIFDLDPLDVSAFAEALGIDFPVVDSGDFDGSVTASAWAGGVDARAGDDTVGTVNPVLVDALARAVGAIVDGSLSGDASADVAINAAAESIGLDGGADSDTILNVDAISTDSSAMATGVGVGMAFDGSLTSSADAGDALVEASTVSATAATVIAGGPGADRINNSGRLAAGGGASAAAGSGGLSVAIGNEGDVATGAALSDGSSIASVYAVGIDAGADADTIENTGDIELSSVSTATGVAVALDVAGSLSGDVDSAGALSNARTEAHTAATGIDGGTGADSILDTAPIDIEMQSVATAASAGFSVAVGAQGNVVSGAGVSDASSLAASSATGIEGGAGDDTITSLTGDEDIIRLLADSEATGVAASFSVAGSAEGGAVSGDALSEARTDADAEATGIAGGTGVDSILSATGIDATAESTATAVSTGFSVAISSEGDVTAGAAVSDASSLATSRAIGIDGGEDDDSIGGAGGITGGIVLDADSTATGVAASFNVAGSVSGSAAAGDALSQARTDADAQATGIAGGVGSDTITSATDIGAEARATATAVGVSVGVGATREGDVVTVTNPDAEVGGGAISDASSLAKTRAIGVDGGDDADSIGGEDGLTGDITLVADSIATGVAVSLDVAGSVEGSAAAGDALSQARTDADADAIGVSGGSGIDTITSATGIDADATATATAVSTGFSVGITKEGDVTAGAAVSDASSLAASSATGIEGGAGDDTITSLTGDEDIIRLLADSEATGVAATFSVAGSAQGGAASGDALSEARTDADAEATGIAGGTGVDSILSATGIDATAESTATAVSTGFSVAISSEGDVTAGAAVSDASSLATSSATGIDGGEDDDSIGGAGGITGGIVLDADSTATGVAASFSVAGSLQGNPAAGDALSKARTDADASATGIAGGTGGDTITSATGIDGDATSIATAVSAGFTVEITKGGDADGDVSGAAALSDAASLATSSVTGIDGGEGDDMITSSAEDEDVIDLLGEAAATGVAASVTVSGRLQGDVASGGALSDASTTAEAAVTGISGGIGTDDITNASKIVATTDADAVAVAAGVSVGVTADGSVEGAAVSDASSTAQAASIALSGGKDDDEIDNSGELVLRADSDATGVAASLTVAGSAKGGVKSKAVSDASVLAESQAIGIDGGDDDDSIFNEGQISLFDAIIGAVDDEADAVATAVAVSLNVSGSLDGDVEGEALSDSSATAVASGFGIAGGAGTDSIENWGNILADIGADALGVAVVADVTVSAEGNVSGAALADASATALAEGSGIDGGDDNDDIDNRADIDIRTEAESDSVSVSVSLAGSMDGVASGKAVATASADSTARSIGIAGGGGGDDIDSAEDLLIRTEARTDAESTAVSVQGGGAIGGVEGAAVADASARGESYSAGLDGGSGRDTIENSSAIEATAKADAVANATTVTVTLAVGSGESFGTGDSSATARTTVTGIEGGDDDDTITNSADIYAGRSGSEIMSGARAGSTTVSVGATVGESEAEATSSAAALAKANVFGISGGSGGDHIVNSGDIRVGIAMEPDDATEPLALAGARSQTVDVGIAVGSSFRNASSDASASAVSNVAGIAGGEGVDQIENTGSISAFSSAKAEGESNTTQVTLTLGASEGDAQANASSRSTAVANGIDGGLGADEITTDSDLSVEARSVAETSGTALNLNIASLGTASQSAEANSSSTAEAFARGIYGGAGDETVSAAGNFAVTANSAVVSLSRASTVTGLSAGQNDQQARSRAETNAYSLALGLDGGKGDDIIDGGAVLTLNSMASADSSGASSTNSGLNIAGESQGKAFSDATATVTAEGVGIRGGVAELAEGESDADIIVSKAPLTVSSGVSGSSSSSATTDVLAVFGSAEGEAVADASALVVARGIGIEGGADADQISTVEDTENATRGDIDVTATASASVTSRSTADGDVGFGDASTRGVSDASARVAAEAVGIDGGSGDDAISAQGTVKVTAQTGGDVTATSQSDAAVAFGSASSGAVSDASVEVEGKARGIDSGSGEDQVFLGDLVEVTATSDGSVTSTSNANADTTFGDASSGSVSDASASRRVQSLGVDGGIGGDAIETGVGSLLAVTAESRGSVTSTSRANADASLFGDASSSTVTAAASEGAAETLGIVGGADDDSIRNLGSVAATAEAELTITSTSISIADSTFGDAFAGASSDTSIAGLAVSQGVKGDGGNDTIDNRGALGVSASAETEVRSVTVALADSTFGDADTVAESRNAARAAVSASGIEGGEGNDTISADGPVAVAGDADVAVSALTVSGSGPASSDARTLATSEVSGIDGGAGDDEIASTSNMLVTAAPHIGVSTRTFGRGGFTDGQVGAELTARAAGLTGGQGRDTIQNAGNMLVLVGRQSNSTVTSASSVGSSTLIDSGATDEIVGKWLRIDLQNAPSFFSIVEAYDADTSEITLRDPVPYATAAGTTYTVFDVDAAGPDIEVNTVNIGGRVRVGAATEGEVTAQGIAGGEGDDTIDNAGQVAVRASNVVKAGVRSVANNIQADLSTRSQVQVIGIDGDEFDPDAVELVGGADTLSNLGTVAVEAGSSVDFSGSSLSYFGATAIDADGEADSSATGLRGGALDDALYNAGRVAVQSQASILAQERAEALFSDIQQQLGFAASGDSVGLSAGDGNDEISNADTGVVEVEGAATASVVGTTSTQPYFNFFLGIVQQRTANAVDVTLDATGYGLELGAGTDMVDNVGTVSVLARSVPSGFDDVATPEDCPPDLCVAQAVSDFNRYSETGARATAENRAVAIGIGGSSGENTALNSGAVEVNALAVSTSYARASEVLVADDQSTATDITSTTEFVDAALVGADPALFEDKQLRFADSTGDFLRRDSTVTALNSGLTSNQFTDAEAIGLDSDLVVGTRLRFEGVANFETEVAAFDSVAGTYTLADNLPTDGNGDPLVSVDDPYALSVLSATVEAFDPGTGAFTLSDAIPEGVTVGAAYTVSIVSQGQLANQFTFVDETRIGEQADRIENTWIRFPNAPDFVAFVNDFDPDTGTFTLSEAIPVDLAEDDIYGLSTTRDGASGSTAIARAAGIDLGGGGAVVENGGNIDVRSLAKARTTVEAARGTGDARADGVAEAVGVRTRDGDDEITNQDTGSLSVEAAASARSNTDVQTVQASAAGIDAGEGANAIVNEGTIDVTARLLEDGAASVLAVDNVFQVAQAPSVAPSLARAWGVRTGAADDSVRNSGTIVAAAELDAAMETETQAVGIATGGGGDVVINEGAGSIMALNEAAPDSAVAIDAGDGADVVALRDESSLTGKVELGAGDDALTLAGSATVQGAVSGGEGRDSLRIEDTGGSFELEGLDEVEYVLVDEGTLQVDADITLPAPAPELPSLRSTLYKGGHGKLMVAGTADLSASPSLEVLGRARVYNDGEAFDVLQADAIQDDFGSVTLPADTLLVRFDSDYVRQGSAPDVFRVLTQVDPFETLARNRLQREIADYLEDIKGQASSDLQDWIGNFQLLRSEEDVDAAFSSLSPDQYDGTTLVGFDLQRQLTRGLRKRMGAVRARRQLGEEYAGLSGTQLALAGTNNALLVLAQPVQASRGGSERKSRLDLWFGAFGQRATQDAEDGFSEFDFDSASAMLGIDAELAKGFIGGLSLGYASSDVDQAADLGSADIDAVQGSLYGTWFADRAYAEGSLSYARQSYENRRNLSVGSQAATATSEHDANAISIQGGGGYRFDAGQFALQPFGELDYVQIDEDGFTETGAGGANLVVEPRKTESLVSEIGLRVARALNHHGNKVVPYGSFAWKHDFDIDDDVIVSGFAGAPGTSISVPGRDIDQNAAVLGAGFLYSGKRWSAFFEYEGELRGDYTSNGIYAEFGFSF